MNWNRGIYGLAVCVLLAAAASAQQSSAPAAGNSVADPHASTVRGCLVGQRGNYIVTDRNGITYVLKGVGNRLDGFRHQEVEVKGRIRPGTVKTGERPEKAGSNPSDTVHGVDGIPLQVNDVETDIRSVAKHCKAADQD